MATRRRRSETVAGAVKVVGGGARSRRNQPSCATLALGCDAASAAGRKKRRAWSGNRQMSRGSVASGPSHRRSARRKTRWRMSRARRGSIRSAGCCISAAKWTKGLVGGRVLLGILGSGGNDEIVSWQRPLLLHLGLAPIFPHPNFVTDSNSTSQTGFHFCLTCGTHSSVIQIVSQLAAGPLHN
jgi:hypothetical protein